MQNKRRQKNMQLNMECFSEWCDALSASVFPTVVKKEREKKAHLRTIRATTAHDSPFLGA